jgi:hypothetical protein
MLQLNLLYLCASVSALLFPSLSLESPLEGGESLQLGSVRGILSARYSPTCYYPDGSVAADFGYTTCNLSKRERLKAQQYLSGLTNVTDSPAGFSPCCYFAEGDICLSDGLCYWPPESDGHGNYIYRYSITPRNSLQVHPLTRFSAACTDKSWTDSACPKYCTVDAPNHFETVSFCANTTDFCCVKSVDGDCCEYPELRFNLTIPSYIWAYLENGTNATTAPPSSLPSTTASGGTSGVATSSSRSGTTAASKGGLSAGAGAGIGIAALLVFVGLAIGAFVFWRRRTTTTMLNSISSNQSSVQTRDEVPTGNGNGVGTARDSRHDVAELTDVAGVHRQNTGSTTEMVQPVLRRTELPVPPLGAVDRSASPDHLFQPS